MNILNETEHPDGSATYQIDMSDEERTALCQAGLIALIKQAISDVREYQNELQPERRPDAWMVGEHVFKHKFQADAFHDKFSHSGIIPLYRG